MAKCPHCGRSYREPDDEQYEHPCPRCGRSKEEDIRLEAEWKEEDEEDEE